MKKIITLKQYYEWKWEGSNILPETIEYASIAGRTIWDIAQKPEEELTYKVTFTKSLIPYYDNAYLHPQTLVAVYY